MQLDKIVSTPKTTTAFKTGLRIPILVRIGVTGHRMLGDESALSLSIRKVLQELDKMLQHTPCAYVAVSPLAEGADRLVAKEVLGWHSTNCEPSCLEVPLPMPADEYAKDFTTPESKAEFRELLARAKRSKELDPDAEKFEQNANDTEQARNLKKENRRKAYRNVGLWVVDNCDVLIAIWNGDKAKGMGGTEEIVAYAHSMRRSVVWIDSKSGEIKNEKYENRLFDSIKHHDTYNEEKLNVQRIASDVDRRFKNLTRQAEEVSLDPNILEPVRQDLLPHFARATRLAAHYQGRYLMAGTWVYILAATSVATVTVITLFFEDRVLPFGIPGGRLIWIEVAQILAIVLLLANSALSGWHRKWIDYRFLAERLRAAMFLFVAGIPCDPPMPLGHEGVSDEWTVGAFRWICSVCPAANPGQGAIDAVKDFLLRAWIGDQLKFYKEKCAVHESRYRWLEIAGYAVFGLTVVAAVWHALLPSPVSRSTSTLWPNTLASIAIILPAVGASVGGIRTYREHLRNSKRYESMARYLSNVVARIELEKDSQSLKRLFVEANETMMREHTDWRVVMLPEVKL